MEVRLFLYTLILAFFISSNAFPQCGYIWAQWTNQGSTSVAVASLDANGAIINMTLTANYNMNFTSSIYAYGVFSGFQYAPPNALVPQTTWAAGPGGQTTMCFSQPVENPILLLSSIGNPSTQVTLSFSIPYTVLYDGGGNVYTNSTTLVANEGYCVLEFPGTFTCVTIYSSTPEYYSNLTWGIRNPLRAGFAFVNMCVNDSVYFSSATSHINPPATITGYSWDFGDGSGSVQPHPTHAYASAGNYNVVLTAVASNGCTDTLQQVIMISPAYSIPNPQIICSGTGYSINLHHYTTSGIYYDTFSTVNACDSVIITNLTVLPPNVNNDFAFICPGESYPLPGGSTVSIPGVYDDTFQTVLGCDSIIRTMLVANPVYSGSRSAFICSGETYQLPDGMFVSNAGVYHDTFNTVLGCDSIISTMLAINPVYSENRVVFTCSGENYQLPGGILVSSPGIYHDTFHTVMGCDSVISTTLVVNPVYSENQSASICAGETYQLPSGLIVNSAGKYYDTLQTSLGCDSVIVTTLALFPQMNDSFNIQNVTCSGNDDGSVQFVPVRGTPPFVFQLIGTATNSDGFFEGLATGSYSYSISDSNGCSINGSIIIGGVAVPIVSLGNDTFLCPPEEFITLIADFPGASNRWQNNSVNETFTVTEPGTYWVEVTLNNCSRRDTIKVETKCDCILSIPTAFSPNNDGANDRLRSLTNCPLTEFNLRIFNRWGEKVFETNSPADFWDGFCKGEKQELGAYPFLVTYSFPGDTKLKSKSGNLTLVR